MERLNGTVCASQSYLGLSLWLHLDHLDLPKQNDFPFCLGSEKLPLAVHSPFALALPCMPSASQHSFKTVQPHTAAVWVFSVCG